jgi:hypothetical protein
VDADVESITFGPVPFGREIAAAREPEHLAAAVTSFAIFTTRLGYLPSRPAAADSGKW